MPAGVFVAGTDTGIGKSFLSAALMLRWDADYWKPVQTGLAGEAGDTETVAWLAQAPPARLHRPAYALRAPLSPEAAGRREGVVVRLDAFRLPESRAPLIVEGAGGLLVPLSPCVLQIELIARLGLPVLLAARAALGTINHTLLSLEALRARGIACLGVVLIGADGAENASDIAHHGQVAVWACLPWFSRPDQAAARTAAGMLPAWKDVTPC